MLQSAPERSRGLAARRVPLRARSRGKAGRGGSAASRGIMNSLRAAEPTGAGRLPAAAATDDSFEIAIRKPTGSKSKAK